MGVEKYDDLADAFVYAILAAIENNRGGAIPAMLPESMKY
jgi:hypothetical protein